MRTTLTLDDDVAVRLEEERRKRRTSFKAILNEVLRAGLDAIQAPKRNRQPFRTKGFDLGPSLVGSLDNVEEVLSRVRKPAEAGPYDFPRLRKPRRRFGHEDHQDD